MKKRIYTKVPGLVACVLLALYGVPSSADSSSKKAPVATVGETVQWHDGVSLRSAVMVPDLIADFSPAAVQNKLSTAPIANATTVATPSKGVRLWRITGSSTVQATIAGVQKSNPNAQISPVFIVSGVRMALPGNVIVEFKPEMKMSAIQDWLKQNNYEVVGPPLQGRLYIIKSAPGLAALDLVNQISASGVVKGISPNWWQEIVPK